jgi:hypothetical protein
MDAFWLIPAMLVGMPFLWVFYVCIRRLPESPSKPQVLLHKSPGEAPVDPAEMDRDWTGRPCGSYLDWFFGPGKK